MACRPYTGCWRARHWLDWLIPVGPCRHDSPAEALRGLVPRLAILDDYLVLVESLLANEIESHLEENARLNADRIAACSTRWCGPPPGRRLAGVTTSGAPTNRR
jgi:hypothetical protein